MSQKVLFPFTPKLLCEEALIGLISFVEGVNTALCCLHVGIPSAGKSWSEAGRAKAWMTFTFNGFTHTHTQKKERVTLSAAVFLSCEGCVPAS